MRYMYDNYITLKTYCERNGLDYNKVKKYARQGMTGRGIIAAYTRGIKTGNKPKKVVKRAKKWVPPTPLVVPNTKYKGIAIDFDELSNIL